MTNVARLAEIGALMGDPARCAMLVALLEGRAYTASELAASAGVTASTASSHLAQLAAADLIAVVRQGRHRYHRLASAEVAQVLESVMTLSPVTARKTIACGPRERGLRHLRTCYDHLAGRLAVTIAQRLEASGHLVLGAEGGRLTPEGEALLADFIPAASAGQPFVRPCLDWSERRFHIGGQLGASLQQGLLARGWIRRDPGSRAVAVTPTGGGAMAALFGLDLLDLRPA